ncbi:MAG TPA: GAF domain-containing protein, partial [Micavibrio sp.]
MSSFGLSTAAPSPKTIHSANYAGKKLNNSILYAGIAISIMGVFLADVQTPLGIAVWVLYILPLILSLWIWRPSVPLLIAVGVTILMVVNFLTDEPGMDRTLAEANRAMGLISIWSMAIVSHFFIRNKKAIRRHEWLQTGQTKLSALMIGEQRPEELGETILGFLTEYLDAQAGAFFTQNGSGYQRIATYGVPAGGVPDVFELGEGLLGQAAKDGRAILIKDVPDGYLTFGSALGKGKPRHLAIFSAAADGMVNAVFELGFVHPHDSSIPDFLDRISESIGVAVRSANYRANLQNLLEETQRQSEELQTQSEELRVSNEELEEQSRTLQESQYRLEQQQAELEQTNAQLEEQTQMLETQRDDLEKIQSSLQLRSQELQQASQYKSDFLANMSHELRTPLNS